MDVTLHIPDEFAKRLKAVGGDLSRRALEAFALEEYKLGHLTKAELRRLLGFRTLTALNSFLKARGVTGDTTLDYQEHARDRAYEAAQAIREMGKGVRLGGIKIKDLINEGRL